MNNEFEKNAAKPSDLWRDLLQMQLMMLRDMLPADLKGNIQFRVSDGVSNSSFFISLAGPLSDFKIGELAPDAATCLVETTELQVSQVLFEGSANLLDMSISGERDLFVSYIAHAARMKEALR